MAGGVVEIRRGSESITIFQSHKLLFKCPHPKCGALTEWPPTPTPDKPRLVEIKKS